MSNVLRAVIIDDEIAAISALKLLLEKHISNVVVVADSTEPQKGIDIIESHRPDIVFLDVSMPDMSGFSLLKQLLYKDFNLVFTTAHERFAIQAIKHHATDYLLKPVDIDELRQTIRNIEAMRSGKKNHKEAELSGVKKRMEYTARIGLPMKEGLVYLMVSDIIWIESNGSYCVFHTVHQQKYMVSKNIGEYEELLPEDKFFRAHKSHLINVAKVKRFIRTDGYFVEMENGSMIEIARRKKDDFLQLMNELN